MKSKKIVYIFLGTTAELIKLIPVIKELKKRKATYRLVLSGQTDVNFKEFEKLIGKQKIYYSFKPKGNILSPLYFAFWALRTLVFGILWAIKELRANSKNNVSFLVQGDTVTALIGAIISKFVGLKLAHVEAGLRTHNLFEPFPEEICRTLISYFADIHFCPNRDAFKNIKKSKGKKVSTKYNTSVESLSLALKIGKSGNLPINKKQKYFIFIVHRQEHIFFKKDIIKKLIENVISHANKDLKCLFVVHDVTKAYLKEVGLWNKIKNNSDVVYVSRLSFIDYVIVLKNSEFIITDGGGNQTEAHFLGKPCLIFRKYTEQDEGLDENIVICKEKISTIGKFIRFYRNYRCPKKKAKKWPSEIIVDSLIKYRYIN